MWLFKVAIEITGLPLSLYLTRVLKKNEALDIYDNNTNFSVFSFDVNYTNSDNQYKKV